MRCAQVKIVNRKCVEARKFAQSDLIWRYYQYAAICFLLMLYMQLGFLVTDYS